MDLKCVEYKKDENGIARITVNRAEVRNALNRATRQEIRSVISDITADTDVRVAVITGAGDKSFISGADINEFKDTTPVMMEEMASDITTWCSVWGAGPNFAGSVSRVTAPDLASR